MLLLLLLRFVFVLVLVLLRRQRLLVSGAPGVTRKRLLWAQPLGSLPISPPPATTFRLPPSLPPHGARAIKGSVGPEPAGPVPTGRGPRARGPGLGSLDTVRRGFRGPGALVQGIGGPEAWRGALGCHHRIPFRSSRPSACSSSPLHGHAEEDPSNYASL